MLRLSLAQLSHRPLRYLWLALGVFVAVAVTVGTAAISASLTHSAHQMIARGYENTDVVISIAPTEETVAEQALAAVRETPGVADAVFDQIGTAGVAQSGSLQETVPVAAIAPGPQQWRTVLEGRLPESPAEVVTTASDVVVGSAQLLRPGERGNPVPVTVVGRVSASAVEELERSAVWLAHPQAMAEWFPQRATGQIRVSGGAGTDPLDLSTALESSLVPVSGASVMIAPTDRHLTTLVDTYLSAQVTWFVILGVFLLAVGIGAALLLYTGWLLILRGRATELAALRVMGATSGQQRTGVVLAAAVITLPAWALAVPTGMLIATALAGQLGSEVPLATVTLEPVAHLIIAAAALALSAAAASSAFRSADHRFIRGTEDTGNEGKGRVVGLVAGALSLGVGWSGMRLVEQLQPPADPLIAILVTIALIPGTALLCGVVIPTVWRAVASGLSGRLPAWLHLGIAGAGRHRANTGTLIAVLVAGTALTSMILNAEQPVREVLTHRTGQGMAGDATDVVITGTGETLNPDLLDQLRSVPGVAAVVTPPTVTVSGAEERTDTAYALEPAAAAAVLPEISTGQSFARSGEVILGVASPLRSELVNGSLTILNVLGKPYETTVVFGTGPRTLIDPALAREAQAAVAAQRGVPVDIAPDLPAPVALVRLTDQARHDLTDPTLEQIRGLLRANAQQVSLKVEPPATAEAGPPGWLVAVVPGLLVLLVTWGTAVNLVALGAPARARGIARVREIGVTAGPRLGMAAVSLALSALPAAAVGVLVGDRVADTVVRALVPSEPGAFSTVSGWTLGAITAVTTALVVCCGIGPQWRRGRSASPPATPPALR